jgi:hypothetical protein
VPAVSIGYRLGYLAPRVAVKADRDTQRVVSGWSSRASPRSSCRSANVSAWSACRSHRWARSRRTSLRSESAARSAASMHSFARARQFSPEAIQPPQRNTLGLAARNEARPKTPSDSNYDEETALRICRSSSPTIGWREQLRQPRLSTHTCGLSLALTIEDGALCTAS